jgi:hypothetical protein
MTNHDHNNPRLAPGSPGPDPRTRLARPPTTMAQPAPRQLDLLANLAPAAQTKPDVRRWLQQAAQLWSQVHQRPMTVRWARDLALLKPLLALHGWDELAARWRAYITTADPFLATRGWDVPTFSRCIDRYLGHRDRAADIALRNLRPIRDPLTGAVLGRRKGW